MIQNITRSKLLFFTQIRFLPYFVLGGLIFYFNSTGNLNYFFKGYLTLLESQVLLVMIYFILSRISKTKKRTH